MTSPIAMHGDTLAPLMRKAGFRYVFLGIENILEDDLVVPEGFGEERISRGWPQGGKRHAAGHRSPSPQQDVCCRRADRRQSRTTPSTPSRPTWSSRAVRRLALHPASYAVSRHANDERLPRAQPYQDRPHGGVRRHDGHGCDRTPAARKRSNTSAGALSDG